MSSQSRTRVVQILGPAFTLAAITMLLAGCTGTTSADTSGSSSSSSDAVQSSSSLDGMSSSAASSAKNAHVYKNGTYSAAGTYQEPSGTDQVDVTITLKDDMITDATFQGHAQFGRAQMMQQMFSEGFKSEVVGKNIDQLSLGVVNGSSLTPMGFMDAVEKIKAEAKA